MTGFIFETTPKIVAADGAAAQLGQLAGELGITRALIVTDRGLIETGMIDSAMAGFTAAGIGVALFSDVLADPPQTSVEAAVAFARAEQIDGVIGFGGGSSMDTAKLVALIVGGGETMTEIFGVNRAHGPRLKLIQVPTTSGTGSEVTPIAIVTTPDDQKVGVVTPHLYPDIAVLDATLTIGLPPHVTAMTGIDAMVHAIEAYTSKLKKNVVSDALALKALALLSANLPLALADGTDIVARRALLQGSMLAGMAFANAPVAAVHALAYPLGGLFHVPHGLSNALVLGPVLGFNLPVAFPLYAELASALVPGRTFKSLEHAADSFVSEMAALVDAMPMPRRMSEVGVTRQDIERMAIDAMKVQRLLVNNPREVTEADAVALYLEAL